MYKFPNTCKFLKRGKLVIIANIENGKWIRLSEELFKILKMISQDIDVSFLEYENDEDKCCVEKLINKCLSIGVLVPKEADTIIKNWTASVEMTHRCNLHCIHCCIDANGEALETSDLSTEEMKVILKKLISWNPNSIMLSGGEPMLRRDFLELASYLRQRYEGKIIISTNGTLISKENVESLVKIADQFDISLDGYNEETCSKIRGKGVFQKVINAVYMLQSYGFDNISLSMVFSDKNEAWKSKFEELNTRLNTIPNCRIFSPTGRGKENKNFFTNVSKDEIFIPLDYIDNKKQNKINFSCCLAGSREVFLDFQGNVYPCPSYTEKEYRLGNILKVENLSDLTVEYNHLELIIKRLGEKKINAEKCRNCCVNMFCWTCPGAVEFFDSQNALTYQCEIVYPILMERVWGEKIK